MKTAILASLVAALVSASPVANNATFHPASVAKPNVNLVIDVAPATIAPYAFNLLASDGTYLSQEYASAGAYLYDSPSPYRYYVPGTTLVSTSSDVLGCYGGDSSCSLAQPDSTPEVSTCKVVGSYPSYVLKCTDEKGASFGNDGGYLVYGSKAFLAQIGATPIKFTLEPCSC